MGGGGQGGCERRIEVFVKIIFFFLGGGGSWSGEGGSGWGVRGVGVNEELKFLRKFTKNRGVQFGGGGGFGLGGVRVGGGGGRGGC